MIKKVLIILLLIGISVSAQTNFKNQSRLAKTYSAAGDFEKAKNIYQHLLKLQPNNIAIITELNEVYLKLKEYDLSIELLSNQIKKSPNDIRLYCQMANTYYETGDHNRAFELWDEAVNVKPDDKYGYKMVSGYAITNRAFNKATEILELGKERTKDVAMFAYDLANIYSITSQYKKAAYEYCELLKSSEKQINLVRNRIVAYINKPNALEETIPVVKSFYEETENLIFMELEKFLYFRAKKYEQFYAVSLAIDSFKKNGTEVYNFANSAYSEKEYSFAAKAYKYVIEKYPGTPFIASSQIGYAKTLEAELRENSDSSENWKTIDFPDTSNSLGFLESIKVYNEIIKTYPNANVKVEAKYRTGLISFEKLRNYSKSASIFDSIVVRHSYSPYATKSLQNLGEISILEGNLDKAEDFFKKAEKHRKATPDEKEYSRLMISKILFWKGKFNESLKSISHLTTNLAGNNANDALELEMIINTFKRDSLNLAKYANAELLIAQNNFEKAETELKLLTENKNLFLLNDFAAFKYSEILITLNNFKSAIIVLEKIAENEIFTAFSDKGLYLLALTYENGIEDKETALKVYEKLLEKFPNSLYLNKSRKKINLLKKSDNR
ncbi:MAG: tetratricopeptide repeat protein [Melioribacteraceae bacterium]|nr:tetratricopeptide repeat protein [Melioribacteraceae bacterium]